MNFKGKKYFFNRDLSWLEFNNRVLSEGLEASVPLMERMKFLSITSSNFDEFFMVRVATLKRAVRAGNHISCPSGLTPDKQLSLIDKRTREIVSAQYACLKNEILPGMREYGVMYLPPEEWSPRQLRQIQSMFNNELFPVLSPVRIDNEEPFPYIAGLRLHLLFSLEEEGSDEEKYALVQIPEDQSRVIYLPDKGEEKPFALLEDILLHQGEHLFPGYSVREAAIFRITRDADMGVDEQRDEDFVEAMEEVLENRKTGRVIRMELSTHSPKLKEALLARLETENTDIYEIDGPLDLKSFMGLALSQGGPELHDPEWPSYPSADLQVDETIWETLKDRDVLLHHPYDSFDTVVKLVQQASVDPEVLAIKMVLYRTSGSSPIVKALKTAAAAGKHVTVVVELKARFDEARNIRWAEELERAGVIVVYGIAHLKIHTKLLMIVRREVDRIRRYIHLGTGNYNDSTAKLYTDMGLLTSNDDIGEDASMVFNAITGYSNIPELKKIVMAPTTLKTRIIQLIEREASRSSSENPGLIRAKMNSLADPDVIKALYEASMAGVKIELNIRGICMLVPGKEPFSSNITVLSVIDRYLEHTRLFHFQNGGNDEYFLASADWMPRNLERRVELMFPVTSTAHKHRLDEVLNIYFHSNSKTHLLNPNGAYDRVSPGRKKILRAQEAFYQTSRHAAEAQIVSPKREFTVRRKPPVID